jgi:hypothetical protein
MISDSKDQELEITGEELESVIGWVNNFLVQGGSNDEEMAGSSDSNISLEQKKKLVRVSVLIHFEKGRLAL